MDMPLPWIWSWDPQILLGLALAVVLYTLGLRYSLRAGLVRHISPWRVLSYGLALVAIFLALESPVDKWSEMFLTAHMVQHELLMFVAAPLLVMSAPLMPLWRAVPLGARRQSLRWGLRHPTLRHGTQAIVHTLTAPKVVWLLFVGDFLGWHLPGMYDLALRNQVAHDLEHLLFLGTGVLFWAQLIASPPYRPRLEYVHRALYMFYAVLAMGVVALAFIFVPTPLYGFYAAHHLAGGPSVIVDQSAAGGLMNATTVAIFGTTFMLLVWKWLEDEELKAPTLPLPKHRACLPETSPVLYHGRQLRWTPVLLHGESEAIRGAAGASGPERTTTAPPSDVPLVVEG